MHFKQRMLDGLYVVGGGVVNRRHRSPDRRGKPTRTQTAFVTSNTYKNGRPRLMLTSNLTQKSKPSASSIPSSSIPASLPEIGSDVHVNVATNQWPFSVKGVPKELHGNQKDGVEFTPGSTNLPLSAPPIRRGNEAVKVETSPPPNQRGSPNFDHSYGGQFLGTPRVRSAPNMNELQDLSITTVSLTTRSINHVNPVNDQQSTQRYTLPSPAQMFDETGDISNNNDDCTETSKLPQTPKIKPGNKQAGKPSASNFQGKLMRIRNILDKSPEYDGPIKFSPSDLRPTLKSGGIDKLLIMRQMPRRERHQRSPRSGDATEHNLGNDRPVDMVTVDSNHHGNQRERSMIMEINQLSRKHAAKSVRSSDSKDGPTEASRSQTTTLHVTSATVPKEELPRETMVNEWLGDRENPVKDIPDGHKKRIVLNVPSTEDVNGTS